MVTFPAFKAFARLNVRVSPTCPDGLPRFIIWQSLQKKVEPTTFYDVKFYPYTAPGVGPVFAVVGGTEVSRPRCPGSGIDTRQTIVCRPSTSPENAVEVIAWFQDSDVRQSLQASKILGSPRQARASLNSCVWSRDLDTGDPLLCVTGERASIKVLNIRTGGLVKVTKATCIATRQFHSLIRH